MPGALGARLAAFSLINLACASPPAHTRAPHSAFAATPAVAESDVALPRTVPVASAPGAAASPAAPAPNFAVTGPFTFEAAAPDGRWLVTCQARADSDGDGQIRVGVSPQGELQGDALTRYLSLASGAERAIDDLLASSADGRWLVLEAEGRSELFDTSTGARLDLSALGADTRREPERRAHHRTLVLQDDSLFYLKTQGKGGELVERRLSTGAERSLYRSAEPVLRFELDTYGKVIVVTVAGPDANGNGRFDWPYELERGKRPCQSPVAQYRAARLGADPLSFVVVERATGEARRFDDLAVAFGSEVVRRCSDGALVAEYGARRRTLADSTCAGRVLWLDPWRDQLLVGCTMPKKSGRLAVELVAAGRHSPLEIDVAALPLDEFAHPSERLMPLYPGADTVLFDAEKRLLHRLKSGDAVLHTAGAHALVRRGRALLLFDAERGSESTLPGKLDALSDVLKSGTLVFASPYVVDVAEGRILGAIGGRPLALSSAGAALVPAQPPTANSLAEGPLSWQTPTAAE